MSPTKQGNRIRMHVSELETPILMIDLDVMERNLHKMAAFFKNRPAKLRPHTKTHKTAALAHKQIEAGAIGICCGSLDEAEVMISRGIRDVLVTREIVSPEKTARVAALARHSDIMIVVDDEEVANQISQAGEAQGTQIRTLVDVDLGLGRCGVQPGEPALALSRRVANTRGLQHMGLMGYEGSKHGIDAAIRDRECRQALKTLMATKELVERDGIAVEIVSGGATTTYKVSGSFPGVTEVQAGTYLIFDAEYHSFFPEFECALTVLTTVISRPSRERVTTDAGKKKLTEDSGLPTARDSNDLRLLALNEEHGILELTDLTRDYRVGDKLEIIPSHGCTTFNLYDQVYGMRNDLVETIWDIAGRGT